MFPHIIAKVSLSNLPMLLHKIILTQMLLQNTQFKKKVTISDK